MGMKGSISKSIGSWRRSYPSMAMLMRLIGDATRKESVISLGGGIPGLPPPEFIRRERIRLNGDRFLWPYLSNYTASEGILECRLAAALDTLDFCGYLDFKKQFGKKLHIPLEKLEKAEAKWDETTKPPSDEGELLIYPGDPLSESAISPGEVTELWNKTIGKNKNWRKGGLGKYNVSKYFYLYSGSTNALWHSINIILRKVAGQGNSAVLAEPTYIGYVEPILDAGGKIEWVPYDEGHFHDTGRYRPNMHLLKERVKKSKAFFLLTPGNPTGAVYEPETIKAIVNIVNDANAVLISDDAYRYLTYDSDSTKEAQFAFKYVTENAKYLIRTVTMAKEASSPGHSMGYVMTNIPQLIEFYLEKMSAYRLSMSGTDQAAMAAFFGYRLHRRGIKNFLLPTYHYYLEKNKYIQYIRNEYADRRSFLVGQLIKELGLQPGTDFVKPQGALYVFPNFEKVIEKAYGPDWEPLKNYKELKRDYAKLLKSYKKDQDKFIRETPCMRFFKDLQDANVDVVMVPGVAFGPSLGTYFRTTFATASKKQIEEAVLRLQKFVFEKSREQ